MIEITDITLSKQTVKVKEQVVITIGIRETVDYPFDYPFDYPISHTGDGNS